MTLTETEIASQPDIWREALRGSTELATAALARPGERVLVLGCGTSAFVAQAVAARREAAGLGWTDAAYASEPYPWRDYDAVVVITRSGTTTEVVEALRGLPAGVRTVGVLGVTESPVGELVDEVLPLGFADEESVVQTRFPTTVLLLARAAFGEDVSALPDALDRRLERDLPVDVGEYEHFVYLGRGWAYGLAQEAALKIREAAQAWAESYPLLDYRHGPVAVATSRSLVWQLDGRDEALAGTVEATGATVLGGTDDPLIELVDAQRLAVAVALGRDLDPDRPRHLTRSIVLA